MSSEPTTPKFVYPGPSPEEHRLYKNLMMAGHFKAGKTALIKSIAPYETNNPCKELDLDGPRIMNFMHARPLGRSIHTITIHKDGPNNYVHIDTHIYNYEEFNLFNNLPDKYKFLRGLCEPGFIKNEYSSNGQKLGENKCPKLMFDYILDLEPQMELGSKNFLIQSASNM